MTPVRRVTATDALRDMKALADPVRARNLLRFFRTGPGEYGAGDRFLGLTMPQLRALQKAYAALPLAQVETLLESRWHEARALGVALLAARYPRAEPRDQTAIYRMYLRRTDRVNNWDLVDISAPQVVGGHLLRRSRSPLRRLARSRSVWERRIAVLATFRFIREGEFDDALALARALAEDRHDLIHKATGWMLREVGKRDERVLRRFLDREAPRLPRTTLRYAIERLPLATRKRYLAMPRSPRRVTSCCPA